MSITIKKLDKNLLNDFLRYFDNIAFADHKEWSNCYCTYFHCDRNYVKLWDEGKVEGDRNYAIELIENGKMQGYMAYKDNNAVGWCNANDKTNLPYLVDRTELWDINEYSLWIKSIVCFLIAPEMRGKGIATKLLEQACKDAEKDGYEYIEAYPRINENGVYMNYYGPYHMYEKNGFSLLRQFEQDCIVRKCLVPIA
jgi:GNAT superfamily N-acetyltransferase